VIVESVPPIAQVVWIDSFSMEDDWTETGVDIPARLINSSGYVVSEDEDYIVLAASYDPYSGCFSNAIAVLKRCILAKHEITG